MVSSTLAGLPMIWRFIFLIWRKLRDSNPWMTHAITSFPGKPIQPLLQVSLWSRGWESNPRSTVLQTVPIPLGNHDVVFIYQVISWLVYDLPHHLGRRLPRGF